MTAARRMTLLTAAVVLGLFPTAALAHKPSDSYLALRVDGDHVAGRWDVALRDLDYALELDTNGDGAITGRELRTRQPELAQYLLTTLQLRGAGARCDLSATGHRLTDHSDGTYAVLDFEGACPGAAHDLQVDYAFLFALDPQHRGLMRLERGDVVLTGIFRTDARSLSFEPQASPNRGAQLMTMIREGVYHIWIGLDHILFLIALLLPSVFRRSGGRWEPAPSFWPALVDVAKVVTAFTIAHSVTLALATLQIVVLPGRIVETAIAVSVALAALNNLRPVLSGRWLLAFGLGLLHGFGFSSVLVDLGLPAGQLALSLLGFNLGVELGQLAIVAAFLPVAFWLRGTAFYRWGTFTAGSAAIAVIACVWSVQRFLS